MNAPLRRQAFGPFAAFAVKSILLSLLLISIAMVVIGNRDIPEATKIPMILFFTLLIGLIPALLVSCVVLSIGFVMWNVMNRSGVPIWISACCQSILAAAVLAFLMLSLISTWFGSFDPTVPPNTSVWIWSFLELVAKYSVIALPVAIFVARRQYAVR